ncbi:MAG: sugar phosphate isomerase/epimerase [Clostridia bacterium]|nr:sugar phosphate isomerase/epimerase [Clostridia bacterium]
MREIGINLHAVKGLTDEEYIKAMASVGFTATFSGVLDAERQAEAARLGEKYGVRFETLHAPFNRINNMWLEGAEGEETLADLMHCVDHCVIAGAPIAVVHLSSGMTPPSITDLGRERFAGLVDYAQRNNVQIAFENQRMLANLAWAMEAFPGEPVGFCWDCGHEFCFTPGRHYMPLFGDRLICTHIHDNTAVFNEDRHWLPFDGVCDFDYVTETLKQSGYNGSLMLEIGNRERYGETDPYAFLERASEAAAKLRRMIDGE